MNVTLFTPRFAKVLLLAITLSALWPRWSVAEPDGLPHCVAEVLVTAQKFDAHFPWKKGRPESRAGYGIVMADGKLITTEDLVRNAMLIEIQPPGRATKTTARVIEADPRINAALLEASTAGYTPAQWGGALGTGAKVQIIQFDEAGQPQGGDGRITSIKVSTVPNAPLSILTFQVLTDLKLERVGSPAFHEGKLAGLIMEYDDATQTSQVLPTAILKRFMDDVSTPPYRGTAVAGMTWSPLIAPANRKFHGLADNDQGILVLRTIPGSGASAVLQAGDVILKWDGYAIDSQGYYTDPDFGRLSLTHQISGRRHPGDEVSVTRWRNKKSEEVQLKLDAYSDSRALVPLNITGEQAEYLVEGGFIFRELSADYLLSYGAQWMVRSNPRLVDLYLTRAQMPSKPGERIIILKGVLPDPINVGYQDIRDELVTQLNGKPVSSMRDVFAIRDQDGGLTRIRLKTLGLDLVMDQAMLPEANRRIALLYGIPKREHRKPLPAVGPLKTK
jgi:S1-C subfamily serine protease